MEMCFHFRANKLIYVHPYIKMKLLSQRGSIAIVLSVLMLSVVLAISASIYNLMIQQIRASSQIGHSVVAIYAAESGTERCYFDYRMSGMSDCTYTDIPLDVDIISEATYTVSFSGGVSPIISVGSYLGINRRIEISW